MKRNTVANFFPYLVISGGVFGWAFLYVFIKLLSGAHTFNISLMRFAFALICFTPIYFLARRKKIIFLSRDFFIVTGLGLIQGAFSTVCLTAATKLSSASVASILVNTSPLFVGAFSPFLIKAKNSFVNYIGIFIAFFGVFTVVSEGYKIGSLLNSEYIYGYILGLLAAIFVSIQNILIAKYIKKYDVWSITYNTFISSTIVLLIVNLLFGVLNNFLNFPAIYWLWFLLLGGVSTAFALSCFYFGVNTIGPVKASVFKFLIPVFSVLFAIIIFKEKAAWYIIFGGMLVVFGLFLVTRKKDEKTIEAEVIAE